VNNKHLYPEDWSDVIRPRILSRDGYKCTQCRIKHRSYIFIDESQKVIIVNRSEHEELKVQGYKTYRVFLQVAHRNHDKSNCNDSNLITLCPRCHLKFDQAYKSLLRIGKSA
jgi:5-methylcytosine-specific restriction endonuclease McrA